MMFQNTPTANAGSYGGTLAVYSDAKGTFTGVTFTENEADDTVRESWRGHKQLPHV